MASAKLRFRIDSGAWQSSSLTDTPTNLAGKTVTLSAASYAGWLTARWMIAEYPDGFACPDGWSTDSGGVYYYTADPITGTTPPSFDLPSTGDIDAGQWGKFEFRLLVNGKTYSSKIGVEILSNNGVHDLAFGEEDEFGGPQRQWVEDQKTNLRTFDGALNGGAPVDAVYMLGATNGSLPNAVVWTSIGTTVGFASTSTIPCSFTRTSSTTNAAIDTMTIASVCSASAANDFGVSCLYKAATKDVGRIKFIFSDITNSSEDSTFIVQLRKAGLALADALSLSSVAVQVAALSGLGSGYVSVDNAGNLGVGAGGGGAPTDAPYLTVGAVSGLSNEVDITSLSSTVAFASSSVVPISTTRESSTTNSVVDAFTVVATTSSTATTSFGVGALFRAEDASGSTADIGRAAFQWTTATALSAASQFVIQLRTAGAGLANKFVLDSVGKVTIANLELTGLATGYLYSTSGVVSIGATPAPYDAPFLTVGAVSGLSSEVDVTAIGTTVAFASTTTEPIAVRRDDSDTNGIVQVCSMRRSTAGTAANGIGGRIALEAEATDGSFPVAGYLTWRLTTATAGSEASELGFWTRTAGGALVKNMYLDGVGALTVVGSVTATGYVGTSLDPATSTTLTIGGTNASAIGIGHGTITLTLTGLTDSIYAGIAATKTTGRSLRNTTSATAGVPVQLAPSDVWEGRARVSSADRAMRMRFTVVPKTGGSLDAIHEYDTAGSGSYSTAYYYTTLTSSQFIAALVCSTFSSAYALGGFQFDATGSGMYLAAGTNGLQLINYTTNDPFVMRSEVTGTTDPIRIWASGETKGAAKYIVKFGDASTWTARSGIAGDGAFIGPRVIAAASTPTSSSNAVTFNLSTSQNVHHTATEETTVTISGGTEGQRGSIIVSQPASGRTITMPTNGFGVEYSNDLTSLGGGFYQTAIIDTTNLTRTVLDYIILANGKAFIYKRSVALIP